MSQKTLPLPKTAYVEIPCHGNCITCPLCLSLTYTNTQESLDNGPYFYCKECSILFSLCCTYIECGCKYDDIFFAKLITSFTDTNNQKVYAMPLFESIDEAITKFHLLKPTFTCYNPECKFNNSVFKCYESKCPHIINKCLDIEK